MEIKEKDRKTCNIIKTMMAIKCRPQMYFNKGMFYDSLQSFLAGYALGTNLYEQKEELIWSDIEIELWDRIDKEYGLHIWNEQLSDKEKFDHFMELIFSVFVERFPEYAEIVGETNEK